MIFIDVFLDGDWVMVWCKDRDRNVFLRDSFRPRVYLEARDEVLARKILFSQKVRRCMMLHFVRGRIPVLEVVFASPAEFKRDFRRIEKGIDGDFYNADIPLEEMYMFEHGLFPLAELECMRNIDNIARFDYTIPDLRVAKIIMGEMITLNGAEMDEDIFKMAFGKLDPDIILVDDHKDLILLCRKIGLRLNRFGDDNFPYIKENTYYSYGQAFYRKTPIYLKGRILLSLDQTEDFNIYSLFEGARICRMRIQKIGSHSVGAAITNLLVYQASHDGYLIPYKVGIYERVRPFLDLVRCDRGALTLEPNVGKHDLVAELDFVSMYPSIISKYNLSPETFRCSCCKEKVPQTDFIFCTSKKGIVAKVCDFLISRRLHFKTQGDNISGYKAEYLKWLLVVIFGFQAFKNKKIGCIEIHESINAAARQILTDAIKVCEKNGYEVVHGIVDSLYVKGAKMDRLSLERLATEISSVSGLMMEFKKVYRSMTFLSSVNATYMPVPTSYFGVDKDGGIKVRGIELRQRSACRIVKSLQDEIIRGGDPLKVLKNHILSLDTATADDLAITIRINKSHYRINCPQKQLAKGRIPGQSVRYIITAGGYVEASEFRQFDKKRYVRLLKKAFLRVTGIKDIERKISGQRTLDRYAADGQIEVKYINI